MPAINDPFNRSNEFPLLPPWLLWVGDAVDLVANEIVKSTGTADTFWYYNDTFSADQYAQAIEASAVTNHDWGPSVRVGGAGHSNIGEGYWLSSNAAGTGAILNKEVNGSFTQLASNSWGTYALGDTLRIEAQGTTIRALRNGTQYSTVTDASLSGGFPGLFWFEPSGSVDNWEGGDLVAAPAVARGFSPRRMPLGA